MLFPRDFETMMRGILGQSYERFAAAAAEPCPVSVRLNDKSAIMVDSSCTPVEWCGSGFYLPERPVFALDPLWHCGAYYVQEASSMFLEQLYKKYVSGKVRILDLSAAPGGKSTHVANLMEKGSLLVSNEIIPSRAAVLLENSLKWGAPSTVVCNNATEDFKCLDGFFDVLLCDMPCSGEGMFRKEPEALRQWSLAFAGSCAQKQRNIMESVWDCLRENGLLIYSTCTFNPYENEENVAWIAGTLGAEILESRHFYFHETRGEGLFMAALRKSSASPSFRLRGVKETKVLKTPLLKHIAAPEDYEAVIAGDNICAVPREYAKEIAFMSKNLRVLSAGIPLCAASDAKQNPLPALALSKVFDKETSPHYEASLSEALAYLKGECLQMPGIGKGRVVVCYGALPLGWATNIGQRANNQYPKNWRIKINIRPCRLFFSVQEHPQVSHT